jgi:hypothetical protein
LPSEEAPAVTDNKSKLLLAFFGTFFGILLLWWFAIDLWHSKSGERVSALGAVVGGIIGAGGAVFAVYIAITRQKNEDTAKVRAAVRTEVTTYSKYVIGTLEICEAIATSGLQIPMAEATYIGKNLIEPVIYSAVADRVALLERPQTTVEFYMRIAEAKSNLDVMRMKASGLTLAQSSMTNVQPSNAAVVADSLITALQLAHSIITQADPTRTALDEMVQKIALEDIGRAMTSARNAFPNAESFKSPM